MPRQYPIVVRKITQVSAGSVPTAEWDDPIRIDEGTLQVTELEPTLLDIADPPSLSLATPAEQVEAADDLTADGSLTNADDFTEADALVRALALPEQTDIGDHTDSTLTLESVTATDDGMLVLDATPDDAVQTNDYLRLSDLTLHDDGDTYCDQASAGSNFGSATTMQAKGKASIGNNEKRAFLKLDISRFAQMRCSYADLWVWAQASGLLATTTTVTIRTGTTDPFTEATATWTGDSAALAAYGTQRASATFSAPTTADYRGVTTLAAAVDAALQAGDTWLLATFTTAGGASPVTVTMNTRENASNKPFMGFVFYRD